MNAPQRKILVVFLFIVGGLALTYFALAIITVTIIDPDGGVGPNFDDILLFSLLIAAISLFFAFFVRAGGTKPPPKESDPK